MFNVLLCIAVQHDLRLVVLAALICAFGCWLTFRLFLRGLGDTWLSGLGWQFLAGTASGSCVWSTHFIAILAFRSGAPFTFDAVETISSLLIAITASVVSFAVASREMPFSTIGGGLVLGMGAASMHYIGMSAYHLEGLVEWKQSYVAASVVVAVVLAIASIHLAKSLRLSHRAERAAGALALGIVGLHFTGMTAMTVTPLVLRGAPQPETESLAMALAIALACILIAGTGLTSFILDQRMRSDSDRKLSKLALYDTLTGLPNRPHFSDRFQSEIANSREKSKSFAVIGMDLDRFKEINDLRGHLAGDQVLAEIGERLRSLASDDLMFARTGGDEFAAICRSSDGKFVLHTMLNVKALLNRPFKLGDGSEVSAGVSLGAAFYPADATEPQELINKADLAMYRAKASPTTSICFYDAAMDETLRERKALAVDLRGAIARHELELFYQVQNLVSTGRVTGFEVLLRWKHAVRGYVPPSEFIPIAEESALIIEIGRWVLRNACLQAASWPNDLRIAVNLSPVQFSDATLPDIVADILKETGLAPERLELELTESTVVEHRERTLAMIRRIKALGVTIALDDFGTGYSSLETLRSFPFDKIKLDRSFMNEIEESPQARAIVRAVLALGKSLEIPILAEGVETRRQMDILDLEGCDAAQGFYLGRPAPHADILAGFETPDEAADANVAKLQEMIAQSAAPGSSDLIAAAG